MLKLEISLVQVLELIHNQGGPGNIRALEIFTIEALINVEHCAQ